MSVFPHGAAESYRMALGLGQAKVHMSLLEGSLTGFYGDMTGVGPVSAVRGSWTGGERGLDFLKGI